MSRCMYLVTVALAIACAHVAVAGMSPRHGECATAIDGPVFRVASVTRESVELRIADAASLNLRLEF